MTLCFSRFSWVCFLGLTLLFSALHPPLASALSQTERLRQAYDLMKRWRPEEAEVLIAPLLKDTPKAVPLLFLMGRIRYYQGRYSEAKDFYTKAAPPKQLETNEMYRSLAATIDVTKDYKIVESPHFSIAYKPGPDQILAAYAVQALEKAYERLGDVFGYRPLHRIRVEILEDAILLAKVSPLTEADILRTGTIALCKYNRILLASPRSLLRGYRWLDTLVHEYTHLVINRIAADIPIWMHEGLARYAEALWRRDEPAPLAPYSETLLARALKKDSLIPFEKMHPSMAKLPSQKDAALAYAQVYMVISYFVEKMGKKGIPAVLQAVHEGKAIPDAFSHVLKKPFETFLDEWKAHAKKLGLREFEDIAPVKKILKNHMPPQEKKDLQKELDFWSKPTTPKELGERYLRLGEMMYEKGRLRAALKEYAQATKHWKARDPGLQNKIAQTYFRLHQYAPALPYLQQSLELYPNYSTTLFNLGRTYFHLNQLEEAARWFDEANQVNPFNPAVHRYLLQIYERTKREADAQRARHTLQLLQGLSGTE